jgi:hypothetical protein
MRDSTKLLLGIATLWPIVYMFLFLTLIFGTFVWGVSHAQPNAAAPPRGPFFLFLLIFALHLITMFWIVALIAFYIYNLFHNDRVSPDYKPLWAVVLFLGNFIAMPIYWYLYIWKSAPNAAPATPSAMHS